MLSAEYADLLTREGHQELIDREPVGSGPFLLNEYRSGQYSPGAQRRLLERAAAHAAGGDRSGRRRYRPPLQAADRRMRRAGYPAASQLSILRDDPRLRLTLRPGMNIAYLAFNTRKPPLDNLNVRQAISLAINNQRLMQSIYYGTAETAASILPRASWAYDNDAHVTEYDPAKSREMLRQAGVGQLNLKLWVPTASQSYNPSPLKTAELIQADPAWASTSPSCRRGAFRRRA